MGPEFQNIPEQFQYAWNGIMAVAFFVIAHVLNQKYSGGKVTTWVVAICAVIGSLLFFASSWSAGVAGWLTGLGLPGMVMSIACAFFFAVIVLDLYNDPTYNPFMIWMLTLAPVTAHEATGFVGEGIHSVYVLLSVASLEFVTGAFG